LVQAGVPLLVMSRRLGHSSLAITADTYSHILPQVDQEAADRTAAFIFGPAPTQKAR
jgi:integrase